MVSSEIASLWSSYMSNSLSVAVLKYFLNVVEDEDAKPHVQHAYDLAKENIRIVTEFFKEEGLPIPHGFSDNDVNFNAPRLYSDSFMLFYISILGRVAMNAYSLAYNNIPRSDIRDYFSKAIQTTMDLHEKISITLLKNGLFIKAPIVEVSKEISYLKKENLLDSVFAPPRSIFTVEIMHIFNNILVNKLTETLVMGFGQVSKSKQVKDHMFKKADTLRDHTETLGTILSNEFIAVPSSNGMALTDSTESPFSEKLMMFHATNLLGVSVIGNYGLSLGTSIRGDLIAAYLRFMTEISKHAKDGVDIMIENGWFEQPPQAINHKNLN